jgi:phage portal protein BeeE
MIGYGDQSSNWGSGVEQQMLIFKQMTLSRRLERIEQALEKQLLSPVDRRAGITIEFNLEGLLRGDSLGRAQVNDIRLKNKTITINEVRAQDNQAPVSWGDRPWGQMQDVQLNEDGTVPGDPAGDIT